MNTESNKTQKQTLKVETIITHKSNWTYYVQENVNTKSNIKHRNKHLKVIETCANSNYISNITKGYLMVEALVDWSKDVESGASNTRLLLLLLVSNRRRNCIAPYFWNPSLHFTDPPTILPHFSSLTNTHTHIDRGNYIKKNSYFSITHQRKIQTLQMGLFLFSNKTMGQLWFWKTMMGFGGSGM